MKSSKAKKQRTDKYVLADDVKESTAFLLRLRLPWLVIGLIGGFCATYLISQFEAQLNQNVKVAFFIPIIVYLSDAVGTQTETIYVRNASRTKSIFHIYFMKECLIGITMGLIFGTLITVFSYIWLRQTSLSLSIGLAMLLAVSIAPIIALTMAKIMQSEHQDPAVGAGPFTTIIQNIVSILIYFSVASVILFR